MNKAKFYDVLLAYRRHSLDAAWELYLQIIGRDGLTFAQLRAANIARLPEFKTRDGRPAHSEPDGSDWSVLEWGGAISGELGELNNVLKKVRRGDMTLEEARPLIAQELADVQTYLDLTAYRCGVDLGAATIATFNAKSDQVGTSVKLHQ